MIPFTPGSSAGTGLNPLRWLAFTQSLRPVYDTLQASFMPNTIQVISQLAGGYQAYTYRFAVTTGNLPAWIQPGSPIRINASVTVGGVSLDVSGGYVVKAVDDSGLYFDVNAPRPHGSGDSAAIYQVLAVTNVDLGSGAVPVPIIYLNLNAQKAMFMAKTGTVVLAPVRDVTGAAPYEITLTPGSEYEVNCQPGSKMDLSHWLVKYVGSGTLAVRFI